MPLQKTASKFQKPQSDQEFREMVLQCIDRGLDMFGENTKQIIFWHLAEQKGIKRDAIVDEPDEFVKGVELFFGVGAGKIRKSINREIRTSFELSPTSFGDESRLSLEQLISEARKRSL